MNRIMINPKLNIKSLGHKPTQDECTQYNVIQFWKVVKNITPKALSKYIEVGNSICGAVKTDGVGENNISEVSAVFLDLDDDVVIENVLENEWVKTYACLVHHTYNSTEKSNRLRVAFIFDNPVTRVIAKKTLIKFHTRLTGMTLDQSCIDPGRLFFGSREGSIVSLDDDKRLPVSFADDVSDEQLSEFESPKRVKGVVDSKATLESQQDRIWKILQDDLGEFLRDTDFVLSTFFFNIEDVEEITPQRSNVLRQFRGNPTYRESRSGKSFDIFFNDDGSITWCDKKDPRQTKGHFVEFYHRALGTTRKGELGDPIDLNDHKTFYNLLQLIYTDCGKNDLFKREKYFLTRYDLKNTEIDVKDFLVVTEKKVTLDENKLAEIYLSHTDCFKVSEDGFYYIFNGKFYQSYSQHSFRPLLTNWLKNEVFGENNIQLYYDLMNTRRHAQLREAILNNIVVFDRKPDENIRYVNFENGLFDTQNKTLREHTPDVISYHTNGYEFNPDKTAYEEFYYLLSVLIKDDKTCLDFVKWCACALSNYGSKTHYMLGCYGDSGSGKTTVTDAIIKMMLSPKVTLDDENFRPAIASSFEATIGDDKHGTGNIINRRLVVFTEFSDFRLKKSQIGILKDLVGQDSAYLNYNIKYGGSGSKAVSIALMLTCESVPDIPIDDTGLFRRIYWVKFSKIEKSDKDLSVYYDKLKNPQFLGKLLSSLLLHDTEGYLEYFKSSKYEKEVKEKSKDLALNDDYVEVLSDCVEYTGDPNDFITRAQLHTYVKMKFEEIEATSSTSRKVFCHSASKALSLIFRLPIDSIYDKNNKRFPRMKLVVNKND